MFDCFSFSYLFIDKMLVSLQVWINWLYLWLAVLVLCTIVKLLVISGVAPSLTWKKALLWYLPIKSTFMWVSTTLGVPNNLSCHILWFDVENLLLPRSLNKCPYFSFSAVPMQMSTFQVSFNAENSITWSLNKCPTFTHFPL